MEPRAHIPLQRLKLLVARSLVLDRMDGWRDEAAAATFATSFENAQNAALEQFRVVSPDDESLDTFLGDVHGRLVGLDKSLFITPGDKNTPQAVRAALGVIPTARCTRCVGSAGAGRVCNGHHTDDDIVNGGAACLEPFVLGYFRKIVTEVAEHYRRYCTRPDELVFPQVDFCTEETGRPSTFHPVDWVGGSVAFCDTPQKLVSVVTLTLSADSLDLASLRAIPYVLFHECVCHAFSGLRKPTVRPLPAAPCFDEEQHEAEPDHARPYTTVSDRFAEGWMDFVAAQLCTRVVDGASLIDEAPWLTADHKRHGMAMHEARGNSEAPGIVSTRAKGARAVRRCGVRAAESFLGWLRLTYPGPDDRGWEYFMRISLDWNVTCDQVVTRQTFTRYIADCLNGRKHNELRSHVERYLAGEPVTCLLPPK